jgi:uncharacterized membrane protein YfcA
MNDAILVMVGVGAGAMTTLAGQGGGLLALLAVSHGMGPHAALAITAPGLLAANAHRAWLFRAQVRGETLRAVGPAALFASAFAARWTLAVPADALRALLAGATALALARACGLLRITVSRRALGAAGAAIGALSATSGGAGLLVGPLLVSAGLERASLVATSAAVAVAMHAGRLAGYAAGGTLRIEQAVAVTLFTAGLLAGNLLGRALRPRIATGPQRVLELGTMVVAAACAILRARG